MPIQFRYTSTWYVTARPEPHELALRARHAEPACSDVSHLLADETAKLIGGEGEIAVLAARCGDAFEAFRSRLAGKYPAVRLSAVLFGEDDEERAFWFTQDLLGFYPSLRVVVSLSPGSMRGAAAAVFASKRRHVQVIGAGAGPEGLGSG